MIRMIRTGTLGLLAASLLSVHCATLSEITALRKVEFDLDRVDRASIAGVSLTSKHSYRDLSPAEAAQLAVAIASKSVPLSMTVHVRGKNPEDNDVTARMLQFDWTLLLNDKETVSGSLAREFVFPPGEPTDVPVTMQVDLWEFFGGRAQDLFDLALSAAGANQPTSIALKAMPTIQTPLGPIHYPTPITIVHREVGSP